jgi:hypothetical protein
MKKILLIAALILSGTSLPAHAACMSPSGVAGTQMYNATHNVMQYCNGSSWISMDGSFPGITGPEPDDMGTTGATKNLDMGGFKVRELATPTVSTDAATKAYVDSRVGAAEIDPQVGAVTNNSWCKGDGSKTQCSYAPPTGTGPQIMIATDEKASGTHGGNVTADAWTTRVINTVKYNNIPGASLAGNVVTLPAGTYYVNISTPFLRTHVGKTRLVNNANNAMLLPGSGMFSDNDSTRGNSISHSFVRGVIGLPATTAVRLDYIVNTSTGDTFNGGHPANSGDVETYTTASIMKIGIATTDLSGNFKPPCAGLLIGGSCWYYGAANQSCTTVCSTHGGYQEGGSRYYGGSNGTNANCQTVLDGLGAGGTGAPSAQANAYGCHVNGTTRRRGTNATTEASVTGTVRRACSCTD